MKARTAAIAALGLGAVLLGGCETARRMTGMAPTPCQDTTVTLYFESRMAEVPPIGREIIQATAARLKSCPVDELLLLGLADPVGSPQANLDLSKRRAENVRDAFVAFGLPVHEFTIRAAGEIGAESADGTVAPVRRRVDVTVVMQR